MTPRKAKKRLSAIEAELEELSEKQDQLSSFIAEQEKIREPITELHSLLKLGPFSICKNVTLAKEVDTKKCEDAKREEDLNNDRASELRRERELIKKKVCFESSTGKHKWVAAAVVRGIEEEFNMTYYDSEVYAVCEFCALKN